MHEHRRVYIKNFGPIPVDEFGRTYEVHHIDGNRKNNNPQNLRAVSIQEHFDIHHSQGDWAACIRISARMNTSPELVSEMARIANKGENNPNYGNKWTEEQKLSLSIKLKGNNKGRKDSDETRKKKSLATRGAKNPMFGKPSPFRGRKHTEESNQKNREKKLGKPAHNKGKPQNIVSCPHCVKIGGEQTMQRWHFDRCRYASI